MLINVEVKTQRKDSKLEKLEDGNFTAYLKSVPKRNKANIELIYLLCDYFNVSKKQIKIKSGQYSKNKVLLISDQKELGV